MDRLARIGEPSGPREDDALTMFRRLRATADEAAAVRALLAADARHPLPESLLVAVASTLIDRGDSARARTTLTRASSSPALLMRADLAAEIGDLPGAATLVERVLLRELEHPGARERHRRWRRALGFTDEPTRAATSTTTVVTTEPEAPFRLLREIARGGSAAVYEAEDRELGRRVALKVYHHADRDRAQLEHEARIAARFAGPNVVRILDCDPAHGWIALEWAELGALRERIRANDAATLLPIEAWALPLAVALARVHAAGWTHHDVKPANVLFRTVGDPLLSDFGSARAAGEPSAAGSLGYVSPERLAGRVSDVRDDVFGFGRILEDVLDAVGDTATRARWSRLASVCTGPDADRPADARALVTRLRVE
jgi:tRNA A-37 threonylcarbamoyl transferase component Bud32